MSSGGLLWRCHSADWIQAPLFCVTWCDLVCCLWLRPHWGTLQPLIIREPANTVPDATRECSVRATHHRIFKTGLKSARCWLTSDHQMDTVARVVPRCKGMSYVSSLFCFCLIPVELELLICCHKWDFVTFYHRLPHKEIKHESVSYHSVKLSNVIDRRTEMLVFFPQLGPFINFSCCCYWDFFSSPFLCYWYDSWLHVLCQ